MAIVSNKEAKDALKRQFTDPVRLVELLGIRDFRREGGGVKILCPWHQEAAPDCSVTLGDDGTVRAHCFACGGGGDAFSLIAAVRGLDIKREFPKVLEAARELLGERGNESASTARPAHAAKPKTTPPIKEVEQLWTSCQPVTHESEPLRERGLDPAELDQLGLVKLLPQIAALPRWSFCRKRSWAQSGHRYLVPLYNDSGRMVSLRARAFGKVEVKALGPSGCSLAGCVMADAAGQQLLRSGVAPQGGVLIAEGEPDFWTLATQASDADAAPPAVLGIIAGGWNQSIADRIPDGTRVVIWTHTDRPKPPAEGKPARPGAGAAYAAIIRKTLGSRCDVRIVRQELPDGANKAPDANDILQREGRPGVSRVLAQVLGEDSPPPDWQELLLFDRTRDGVKIRRTVANAVTILGQHPRWRGVLAYDEFRREVRAVKAPPWDPLDAPSAGSRPGPWTDADDLRAQAWLDRHHHLAIGRDVVAGAVRIAAERQRSHHPVREYLQGLSWDGVERLPRVFEDYFGAKPSPYLAMIGVWWPVSAVARVFQPGVKVDTTIILEGAQGKRKSTALSTLAVNLEWFVDTALPIGEKDALEMIRGKWIVEFAELDSWRRTDHRKLKSFLTNRQDTFREAYDRRSADHLRQCVFAGTTNDSVYLDDPTGARRFLPVACSAIDIERLRADRDQIWAEAVCRYQAGVPWWPVTDEEVAACSQEQEKRFVADPWEELVADWLEAAKGDDLFLLNRGQITTAGVLMKALRVPVERIDRAQETRVGAILQRLGFHRHRRLVDGVRRYYYSRSPDPEGEAGGAGEAGR